MAEVLEVLELPHQNRVPKVEIGRSRIEARFDAQGPVVPSRKFQAFAKIRNADDLRRPFLQVVELLINRREVDGRDLF